MSDYAEQRAKALQLHIREALRELPDVCFDFINAIDATTQPLTRYAYISDLKLFFDFLTQELPKFAGKAPTELEVSDIGKVTAFRTVREVTQETVGSVRENFSFAMMMTCLGILIVLMALVLLAVFHIRL